MKTTLLVLCLALAPGASFAEEPAPQTSKLEERPAKVYDRYGNYQGQIAPDGRITDRYGNYQGVIKPDGRTFDRYGNPTGQVKK